MDALRRRFRRITKLTRTQGVKVYFVDVISVLNGNMKHSRTIEFDEANILAICYNMN